MNKVILGLILAVCVLGMALVMLNERLGRKNEAVAPTEQAEMTAHALPPIAENPATDFSAVENVEQKARALAMEQTEARENLAPPPMEDKSVHVPAIPPAMELETESPTAPELPSAIKPEAPLPVEKVEKAPVPTTPAKAAETKPAEARQDKAPKAEKPVTGKVVNRFVVFARDGGATIRVGSPAKMNFSNMTLENPDRVVVDMDGSWQFPVNPGIPKNDMVSKIRTGKLGEKTRVVIDLKGKPRSVRVIPARNGDGFDVRVDK